MEYFHPIHFSLAEAEAMLPDVVRALTRMKELKQKLDASGYDIRGHRLFGGMGTNGVKSTPEQMEELLRLYQALSTKGIVIRDLDRGLIDFPTIRSNGEEVYLCFILGETRIGYWHGLQEGFPGRQSIDSL